MMRQHIHDSQIDDLLAQAFMLRSAEAEPVTLSSRMDGVSRQFRLAQKQRQQRRFFLRRSLAVASVLFAFTLSVTLLPKILVWRAVAQMVDAGERARSVHAIAYMLEGTSRRKVTETWFQNGHWRIERSHGIQIYTGGKLYHFDPRARRATWKEKLDGPFAYNMPGFSIRSMMSSLSLWGWRDKITLSQDVEVIDGRPARVATLEPAHERIRIVFYADPQTLLPFRSNLLKPTQDGWKVAQTTQIEYNKPLRTALFEPKFPKETKVVEEGAGREQWAQSLRKPKAILTSGKQRIVIRDVQMNEAGDIFVLFTAGLERVSGSGELVMLDVDKPDLVLSSKEGSELIDLESSFVARPSMGFALRARRDAENKKMDGVRVDGEPLNWDIWIRSEPLKPAQVNQPQHLTLQVKGQPLSLATNLVIPRATIGFLPDYVHHFPVGMNETDLSILTDEARAHHWRVSANGQRELLQKSLKLYLAIIERTDQQWRESGNQGVQPQRWLTVAKLYFELKQYAEAKAALQRAEEDNRIYGQDTERIEDFKQRLANS
jgi:hypothetical protein